MTPNNDQPPAISVVIPVYNEMDSIPQLVTRLVDVLSRLGSWEILFINDGSNDGSSEVISSLCKTYPHHIRAIHLRRNLGKSAALELGFSHAKGEIIVMMDGDLQDQPEEIPRLLDHLNNNNLDVVTGWKKDRHDPLSKTLPSRLFNRVLRRISGLDIHDFNCGLKVLRRPGIANINL
ncbi:MAG: glycosyltransferase family 2 protein, partial [Magnetococcales bacterium]|nr:glycosyltransferase family 2 protein [Magnetococcales bacterium]